MDITRKLQPGNVTLTRRKANLIFNFTTSPHSIEAFREHKKTRNQQKVIRWTQKGRLIILSKLEPLLLPLTGTLTDLCPEEV